MCKGEDLMHQAYKKAAVLAIITLLGWGGIHSYYRYTQDMIYQESTDSLRATYTQVGTSFRLFTQRNWNILSVYEKISSCYLRNTGRMSNGRCFSGSEASGCTEISISSIRQAIL